MVAAPASSWTIRRATGRKWPPSCAALPELLPSPPAAILVVSGHWETPGFAVTASAKPPLVYDYYGFPPHTYQLRYDAPGDPALAERIAALLNGAGFATTLDAKRGLDHGVFVPLKVIYPEARIPVIELSLDRALDAAQHVALGRALAPLRDQGVLLLGAGMSFHNLQTMGDPRVTAPSTLFDDWLTEAVSLPGEERAARLAQWHAAPAARIAHPRHEHLLPLMVAAGSSQLPGRRVFTGLVLGWKISGYAFD